MLILRRKDGQWVEVACGGKTLRVRLCNVRPHPGGGGQADLVFDDAARDFEISRPERSERERAASTGIAGN